MTKQTGTTYRLLVATLLASCALFSGAAHTLASENLIQNGSFEQVSAQGNPVGWTAGKWGTISAEHVYPVPGVSGNAAEVRVTSRSSGDAKWSFAHVPVTQGTYTYSNSYKSNTTTSVVAELRRTNGTMEYVWFSNPPTSNSWNTYRHEFTVPAGVTSLTVYHLLAQVGTLTLDNVALIRTSDEGPTPDPTPVQKGMISITFDDGWISQYTNGYPLLEQYNVPGTFYMTTMYFDSQIYTSFMSEDNVRELHARGHEIGSHTVTHPRLTTLSVDDLMYELETSKRVLEAVISAPVSSFAYTYGEHNGTVIDAVINTGYKSARTTDAGRNNSTADPYRLKSLSPRIDTPLSEIYQAIDQAYTGDEWLIIALHEIDTNGRQYANAPEYLEAILSYIQTIGIKPVTVTEGYTALFK